MKKTLLLLATLSMSSFGFASVSTFVRRTGAPVARITTAAMTTQASRAFSSISDNDRENRESYLSTLRIGYEMHGTPGAHEEKHTKVFTTLNPPLDGSKMIAWRKEFGAHNPGVFQRNPAIIQTNPESGLVDISIISRKLADKIEAEVAKQVK